MWRGKFRCKLNCKLVESSCIHPLLGCKACIGMNIVSYLDNDEINPPAPATTKYTVYTIGKTPEPVETFKKKYPTLFTDGVGCLEGKYPIRPNQNDESVQHAPRRVPVAVCEQLRSTLEQLVQQDMDQFTRNRSKKEWHFMFLPGPKGSQQGHFAWKLPSAHYQRCCHNTSWCQGVFNPWCELWFLARGVGWGFISINYIPQPIWMILLVKDALWSSWVWRQWGTSNQMPWH